MVARILEAQLERGRGGQGEGTTNFLDASSVLEVLGRILDTAVARLEFDKFHGKHFA